MSAAQKTLILFFGALVALLAACVALWYFLASPGVLFSLALFSFGMLLLREEGEKSLKIILEAYFSHRTLALHDAKANILEILEAPVPFSLREEYEMQQEEIFGAFNDETGTEKKKKRRRFLRRRARPLHRFLTVDVEITPTVTTIDGQPAIWDALEVRFAKYEEPVPGQNPDETPAEEEGAEIVGWEVWHDDDFRLETSAEMKGSKRILYYLHLHGPEVKKLQIRYLYEVLGAPFEVPLLPDAPKTALFHHAARKTAKPAVASGPAKEPEPVTAKTPSTVEKKDNVVALPDTSKKESKEAITPVPEKPGKDTAAGQAVADAKETAPEKKITTEKSGADIKVPEPAKDKEPLKQIAPEKIAAVPTTEPVNKKQTEKAAESPATPPADEIKTEQKNAGAVVAKTPSIPPVQKKPEPAPAASEKPLPERKEIPAPKGDEKPTVEKLPTEKPVETQRPTPPVELKEPQVPLVIPTKSKDIPSLKEIPGVTPLAPERGVSVPVVAPSEKPATAQIALPGTQKPESTPAVEIEKSQEKIPVAVPTPTSVEKPVVTAPVTPATPSVPLKEKLAQGFEKFKTIFGHVKKETVTKTVHIAAVTSVKYQVVQTRYQAFTNNLEAKVKDYSTKLHERNMQKMGSMKITIPPVKIADLKPSPAPADKEAKKKTVRIDESKELILQPEITHPKKQSAPAPVPTPLTSEAEESEPEIMDEDYEEFHYFVIRSGEEQEGPFEYDVVQSMFESGELRSEHLIWYPGLADWTPIHEIEEVIEEEPPAVKEE